MDFAEVIAVLGAVPGVLAILGLVAGYIRLGMRVKVLEDQMAKVTDVRDRVIKIEESSKGAEKAIDRLNDSVGEIGSRMDTFLGAMMGEMRAALVAGRAPSRTPR